MSSLIHQGMLITTKEELLQEVKEQKEAIQVYSTEDTFRSAAFYHNVYSLYDRLITKIEKLVLFTKLEEGWSYVVYPNNSGLELCLVYGEFEEADEPSDRYKVKQSFSLITVPVRYLSVEQYAGKYGVDIGTVRQWIRRGKLRSVRKEGGEWRISELSDKPSRGFSEARYDVENLERKYPEQFSFLYGSRQIDLKQDPASKKIVVNCYKVVEHRDGNCFTSSGHSEQFVLDKAESEKLEVYLCSEPDIEYKENLYESIGFAVARGALMIEGNKQ